MGAGSSNSLEDIKVPVMVHIAELRKLLMICVFSLVIFSTIAYLFFDQLLHVFQKPLGKTLYYTSPTSGFTFVIKLCLTVGLIVSVPLVVNRAFSFVKPAVQQKFHRSFAWYSVWSVILAILGVVFAYFISLPGALQFLTSFKAGQLEALITVDSYFTFFSAYLLGYAILFQTPIIMLGINKIRPLDPGSTMRYQRHVILGSFVVAAVLTPTPDPWNQTLMAIPMILLYQVGIVLVWAANRKRKAHKKPVNAEKIFDLPVMVEATKPIPKARKLSDIIEAKPSVSASVGMSQTKHFDIIS